MVTPGNHDSAAYDKDFVQYKSRFNFSSLKKPEGLSPAAEGTVYSFEYGDALFISINTMLLQQTMKFSGSFWRRKLKTTDKAWKIVYMHTPPYDPGASHYSIDNVTGKKLTDAGVDLVLNGHEHAYARTTLKTTATTVRNRKH